MTIPFCPWWLPWLPGIDSNRNLKWHETQLLKIQIFLPLCWILEGRHVQPKSVGAAVLCFLFVSLVQHTWFNWSSHQQFLKKRDHLNQVCWSRKTKNMQDSVPRVPGLDIPAFESLARQQSSVGLIPKVDKFRHGQVGATANCYFYDVLIYSLINNPAEHLRAHSNLIGLVAFTGYTLPTFWVKVNQAWSRTSWIWLAAPITVKCPFLFLIYPFIIVY